MPVAFDSDGTFSQALDLSGLAVGNHTLTVTAQDAAGNVTHDTVDLNLAAPPALTLSSVAPTDGSSDVGVTFRPKIVFSRPIDTSTLTASDFYLTDSTGAVIPTTIVPSDDGTYAWLFPTNPMPGASIDHAHRRRLEDQGGRRHPARRGRHRHARQRAHGDVHDGQHGERARARALRHRRRPRPGRQARDVRRRQGPARTAS